MSATPLQWLGLAMILGPIGYVLLRALFEVPKVFLAVMGLFSYVALASALVNGWIG